MALHRRETPRPARVSIPVGAAALFLDLDGTLAGFEIDPADVGPDAGRTALLKRAAIALDGRLAVISGRALTEVDRIVEGAALFASGVHGLEHRGVAGLAATSPHPALAGAVDDLRAFAATRPGLIVEDKGLSAAIHYRASPAEGDRAQDLARDIAGRTGLGLQRGDCVVELRTPGADKGDAVRAFMQAAPFAGSLPIYVGDDITDEDAFLAVRALGGAGVLVGPARETAAVGRLSGVSAVLEWLDRSIRDGVFRLEWRT